MRERKRRERGITLIALVITIIIIIILSAITINAALGDNGLLRQTQIAKEMAENSTLLESERMNRLVQEYANIMSEDNEGDVTVPEEDTTPPTVSISVAGVTSDSITVNVTASDPESGLASENAYKYYLNGAEYAESSSSSCTFTGLEAETMYTIKVEVINGVGLKGESSTTATTEAEPGISADEIQKNPETYYGAELEGYTCSSSGVSTWRIFYADESNIYIIADDYIASEYAPTSTAGNSLNVGSTNYSLYFTNILNDYTGSSWIRSNTNSSAREWLSYVESYPSSTNENIKAVAYLMDTNKWSIYAGSNAEYAIGGPTLELFCASYQDTHPSRYINNRVENEDGYYVKWSNAADSSYSDLISGLTRDEYNSIYIKSDRSKAGCMWVASPPAYSSSLLFYANYDGNVRGSNYGATNSGLRPLVCLKSSVQIERVDEDTFRIVT